MRLEATGFQRVYDYVGGKKDWLANGLPIEGNRSGERRAGDIARNDAPTCRPRATIGNVSAQPGVEKWGLCIVVDSESVVHGLLTADAVAESVSETVVADVMELGPTTIRPNRSIESALATMDELETDFLLVTTTLGSLLGVLYRSDASDHA